VYCGNHYENILATTDNQSDTREWLRQSFLRVDDHIRLPLGQNELGDLRRAVPPKKPAILSILGENGDKKDPSQ